MDRSEAQAEALVSLTLRQMDWSVNKASGNLELSGWLEIANPHQRMEIFVPELEVKPVLIGSSDLSDIVISSTVTPHHPDEETRPDGYWPAYIVKGQSAQAFRSA